MIEKLKDMNSTIPGILLAVGGLIGMFRETAVQIIDFVAGLGYAWAPNPTTIALGLLAVAGLKMVFLDGKKEETEE